MKKRELYEKPIHINDSYWIQISKENEEIVNIYKDNCLLESFKLNRKIYTLFKVLQDYIQDDDYITIEDNQVNIYGKEIKLYEDIYMKINADRACLTLDIYQKISQTEIKLIYLTKLIYTCQKLFHMLLIPKKLENKPNYYVTNIFKFLDMIEILGYENS
ncbi:hypothetical protein KHQ81_09140 [Mycoplasmatota bacterium]|nr:hypothetical protein KHQ81_09140 [Mycoplasmatota bacterium]